MCVWIMFSKWLGRKAGLTALISPLKANGNR